MRLFCIQTGVKGVKGDAFHVDIDASLSVSDLKDAIAHKQKYEFAASELTLYLAKNNDDKWLEYPDIHLTALIEELLKGVKLSPMEDICAYFTDAPKKVIHVLVVVPETSTDLMDQHIFPMNQDAGHEKDLNPYLEAAERLKNEDEVIKLDETIDRIQGEDGAPFIVLESSSGMGKTQMAFNLKARGSLDVFYVVCERIGDTKGQKVYSAFKTISKSFRKCVEADYERMVEGSAGEIRERGPFYTYGFISALLTGAKEFRGKREEEDVLDALDPKRRCCIFLDEFPLLDKPGNEDRVKYLRFMRNVFRAFGLVVIISSTNGSARNLVTTGSRSRGDKNPISWCVVFPSLPRFQDPSIESIPEELKSIVSNSRPLFAMEALVYIHRNRVNGESAVEYMDKMAKALAEEFMKWKPYSSWFFAGQVCLFLCTSYVNDDKGNLINGHFARLSETEPFTLSINTNAKTVKNNIPWKCRCMFPAMNEDILLYLVMMGGKEFRTLIDVASEKPLPFYQALSEVKKETEVLNFENTNQISNDGMKLEALVTGSVVIASHQDGFSGIGFGDFFSALLYELGLNESPNDLIDFPFSVNDLQIPFLAPPNVKWPDFPVLKKLNLGNLERTRNNDQIDFLILDNNLSGECKDYKDDLELKVMKKIIKNIPKETKVHLVVTNSLQASYFNKKVTFDDFVASEKLTWLQHAVFYRIRKKTGDNEKPGNTGLNEIKGIENKCRKINCQQCEVKKLVIFIEQKNCQKINIE